MSNLSRTLAAATLTVVASVLLSSTGQAQGRVVEERTRSVVASYEKADHWAMQGIVLLSLGPVWSRAAEPMLLDALQAKDVQLRAYAVEVLALSEPEILQYGVSPELIDVLVNKHAKVNVEVYYERVEEILFNLFPATDAEKAADWKKHWRSVKRDWKRADWPDAYTEEEQERDGATMSGAFVARAFDLYRTGLEVMLVVDSTGSMQSTIDATRSALLDLAAVLHGVAPKLKIGLVHYKDYGDMSEGAKLLEKLSKKPAKIEKALEKLRASGGGDQPEAVEAGLYVALQEDCGWSRAASKLVVVISDAQAKQQKSAEELARAAHEMPFGLKPVIPSDPKSGGARRGGGARPDPVGDDEEDEGKDTRDPIHRSLENIAIAGGGSYSEISATGDTEPALEIVSQVLAQSFGRRFQDQTDRFLDVWMRYHRAGLFD
jgi:hypothetical protein